MGSFHVTCALSGMSIGCGDPCYLVILRPQSYCKNTNMIGYSYIVSNEGAEAFFAPMTLPVLAEYADYGRVEDHKCPTNAKVIEKLFKTKIKKFLENPCAFKLVNPLKQQEDDMAAFWEKHCKENNIKNTRDDEHKYSTDENLNVTACFIHKWAWDAAVKFMAEKADYGSSVYTHFPLLPKGIELIGFKKIAERETGRYKSIYAIDGCKTHVVASDGEYSHIEKANKDGSPKPEDQNNGKLVHSGKHFLEKWKEATGMDLATDELVAKMKATHTFDFTWEKMVALEREIIQLQKETDEGKKALLSMKLLFRERVNLGREGILVTIYKDEIAADNPEIKRLMAEYNDVRTFMYLTGKMFQPTSIGPQCGDRPAERALYESGIAFLNEKDRLDEERLKEEEED